MHNILYVGKTITRNLSSAIKASHTAKRSISQATYLANKEHLDKIAPHMEKQAPRLCYDASRTMLNSIHGSNRDMDKVGFWDRLMNGSNSPEMNLERLSYIPKSEVEWLEVWKRTKSFNIKGEFLTATGERGYTYEDGTPAETDYPDGFHVITVHGLVFVDRKPCFLVNDPEGGRARISRVEASIAKGLFGPASPQELDPEDLPKVNRICELTTILPIEDLVRNARFNEGNGMGTTHADGVLVRPDKLDRDDAS